MSVDAAHRPFVLVEPMVLDQLVDRPHLGCAMLVAACRAEAWPVAFVAGQPDLLAHLIGLDPCTPIGGGTPIPRLRQLHEAVMDRRGPRPYYTGTVVAQLHVAYALVMRAIVDALEHDGPCPVPIVDRIVERIVATGSQVVGFSQQGRFDPLTREIRRRVHEDLGLTTIAGGPLISGLDPAEREVTLRREFIDFLVTGPAEWSLPRLLERLEAGELPDDVPNVYYLQGANLAGREETVRQDLDALPMPDFSDVDFASLAAPETILPLETARGCTWDRCAFCDHNTGPTERYATWSIPRVVETIRHLRTAYRCHEFVLHDLEVPARRALQLSEALLDAGLDDLGLTASARFTSGYDKPGIWKTMRRAGFTMIEWGLESGCQHTLDAMAKGTTVARASSVLRRAAEAGIANLCFVLFGFPGESAEDAEETFGFLREHRAWISLVAVASLDVLPGAPLGRDPERWGMQVADDGTWTAAEGVELETAKTLVTRLQSEQQFDPRRFSDEPVRSVAKINASRVLYGLLRSHRLSAPRLPGVAAADRGPEGVVPVVLGEVRQTDAGMEWHPVAWGETPLINLRAPRPPRLVDAEESAAFRLADGTRSLEEVCGSGPAASIRRQFVEDAVRDGLALAFGRRWEP